MVDKWGEEITQAMIEDKMADDDRKCSEIRCHPDMKPREDPSAVVCMGSLRFLATLIA